MKTQENSILDPFWKHFVYFRKNNNFLYNLFFHILLFRLLFLSKIGKKTNKQLPRKTGYICTGGCLHRLMDRHEFSRPPLHGSNKMKYIYRNEKTAFNRKPTVDI